MGTETTSHIPKGAKLTQGSAVGVTTDHANANWGGVPVRIISGVFDISSSIEISLPDEISNNLNWYKTLTGTLPFASSKLDNSWDSLKVTAGVCSGAVGLQFSVNVLGSDGTISAWGSDNDGLSSAYVSNVGTSCGSPTATVAVTCDAGTDSDCCTVIPTVELKCNTRIEAVSNSMRVKLPSPTAVKFEREEVVTVKGLAVGQPYWINNDVGNVIAVTSSTIVSYQDEALVFPDEDVPALTCYENCPDATLVTTAGDQPCDTCYYDYPSHLNNHVEITEYGKCTEKPTAVFNNINGSPQVTVTWANQGESAFTLQFLSLTDPGMGCTLEPPPTLTFEGGTCITLPTATISCDQSRNDVSDFRQKNLYSFESLTGLLTDKKRNAAVVYNGDYVDFGPFFELTEENKALLLCDWDSSQVCSWKVYQSFPVFYRYSTGSRSVRVALVANDGTVTSPSKPALITYTHTGTTSNSGKNYDGNKMLFSYQGSGDLQGFPSICVSADTGLATDCIQGSSDATLSYPDVNIPLTAILTDMDGNQYFALVQELYEHYPVTDDPSLCNNLDFSNLPVTPEDSFYHKPQNWNSLLPSDEFLASNYLNFGNPVVIKGSTIYDLRELA